MQDLDFALASDRKDEKVEQIILVDFSIRTFEDMENLQYFSSMANVRSYIRYILIV